MENETTKDLKYSRNDLKIRTYKFALNIIKFIDSLEKKDFATEILSKQLIRSATSIGANVIEAQAGSSKKDFTNFFSHALKSANESKFWLCLFRDSTRAPRQTVNPLLEEATELSNILGSSIITLKGKR